MLQIMGVRVCSGRNNRIPAILLIMISIMILFLLAALLIKSMFVAPATSPFSLGEKSPCSVGSTLEPIGLLPNSPLQMLGGLFIHAHTLHYIVFIPLHYIRLNHITLHASIHTHVNIYVYIHM